MATLMKSTPLAHFAQLTLDGKLRSEASGGRIRRALHALRHAWQAYISYKRLARMSDEALASRGLTRHEIGRHAFFSDPN